MKNFLIVISSLTLTPILWISLVSSAFFVSQIPEKLELHPIANAQDSTLAANSAIYSQIKGINTSVQSGDARPIIITQFLESNNSPLRPYDHFGQELTRIADKYGLDFRLLPAIMMQESNLCKKIPSGSFNCLGLGVHSQGTWTFESFSANFEAAAKVLRKNYIDKGYITPDEIQDKYTPGSNGSWEFAVNHFMDILETAEFE